MASNHPETLQSTIDEADIIYKEQIGRGASGDVFHAIWKSEKLGEVEVAAKKIPLFKGKSADLLGNEIFYLQTLDHPNIIKYYGHVITTNYVVIVTEYAKKGSLYDYLQNKTSLLSELKLKWAIQGARGIKYLQENQVLHRDIKSPNFLITADDNLKICDFGISKDLTSTKTTTSEKGTVRWLAPEAFTELQLSPTADIFAFGIVLWELETCLEPYRGLPPMTVMYKVGQEGLRPEIPAACCPVLHDLMKRCWDGDRTKRPKVNEIIQALESGLQWRYKQTINTEGKVFACDWISETHLSVCMEGRVLVYEVTAAISHLAYTLKSAKWERKVVRDAVVSEALPGSVLVICQFQPYMYQYPAHEASREIKKYKIQSKDRNIMNNPWCMAANASVVIISMNDVSNSFIVCHLPDFTHQYRVHTGRGFLPLDLAISTHYLLVMNAHEMVMKPIGDLNQTVCVIKPPDGWIFRSMSCRNTYREIYAVCTGTIGVHKKYPVYKYTWNGSGKPSYVNAGCVVDDLDSDVWCRCLSVTSGGLMAVGQSNNIRIYCLT